ncbi:hypothetical protein Poli38472_003983 [Pythium oligandrum]|uniref:THO complex subunit 1 n=1 Tax=Pythium oligandrum TaxID=41045 RepID=A0A8K1CPW4_PYTOL|nr:hypothetical protein Poli38472_003983 [Pythium oligandrum]|eukprot:TMW66218.1 hypothetical protein Poli38472_003983 [Pythium oligandrum]
MALDLANKAEAAISGFYRNVNAIDDLGTLYQDALATLEKAQTEVKPVDTVHMLLDIAVQKVAEKLSWQLQTESNATPVSVGVPALLDLCIEGVIEEYLLNSAAYRVLEDLMEGQTIQTCEKLWDLLEERKEKLSSPAFIPDAGRTTKASLCLLRMCNALLRRVSKTHNSVFCGRILVFLSFTFALSERSAVNLLGKPNTSNTTVFEEIDAFEAAEASDSAVPSAVELDKERDPDAVPIDYNLYRTFWDLQRFCRDHQLATKSADDWEKFFDELNTVLSAFEGNAFSRDDLERTRELLTGGGGSVAGDTDDESTVQGVQDHFFQPKYLTNSRLFRLQLRDPILRECMLTQFLILFNHLSKAKQPEGCSTPKSKLSELQERVMKLLRETPSDGKGFSELLSIVLERERNWIKWKQEKCPPYERSAASAEGPQEPAPKKRRLGDAAPLSARPPLGKKRPVDSGDSALMEQILSESAKPAVILQKIKEQDRATAVPMEKYVERFTEAWDPENGIEEEYWPDKDKMFCWRTLRMAMKTNIGHMHLAGSGAGAVIKSILGVTDTAPKPATKQEANNEAPSDPVKEEANGVKTEPMEVDPKREDA